MTRNAVSILTLSGVRKLGPHLRGAARWRIRNRGKSEANARAQLDLPVAASLLLRRAATQIAETRRAFEESHVKVAKRIQPLIVVQNVSEHALEFQADALRHPEVLLDAEVHIPVGQASEYARAAVPVI